MWGYCGNCGKRGELRSYTGRRWVHLYYIPIIPAGRRTRVMIECKKCKQGQQVAQKDIEETIEKLRGEAAEVLGVIEKGESEDGEVELAGWADCLRQIAEMFYCLGEAGEVDYLSEEQRREQERQRYVGHMLEGACLEMRNELEGAAGCYRAAHGLRPSNVFAVKRLGESYALMKDAVNALAWYEKGLELEPGDVGILQGLLDVYQTTKDYAKAAETYEKLFSLSVTIAGDKKVIRQYKKVCKKAGREPNLAAGKGNR